MRYVLVTETYPPEVNGVALTVHGLACGLRARGHAVCVVRPRQPADAARPHDADELRLPGAPLPRYPGLRFGLPAAARLRRTWRACRPDAVYVATEGPLGASALRAAKALDIPVATGFHTRFDRYMRDYGLPWLAPVAWRWMRRFHDGADATLVPTAELASELQRAGVRRVLRLPRAVDTALFDPRRRDETLRAGWGARPQGPVVLHVGRIAPEKNLELAVRAFRALQRHRPQARMVWVGDGPARARLQRAHPDFVFCGVQRGEALARHFASGDLFVFPSRSETFGNVTLEAMASGVATVAFDTGAAREHLADGKHGHVVRDGDEAAFVEATVALGCDDARREAMGWAARAAAAALDPAHVAAAFDRLLQWLADGRTHAAPAVA